MNDAELAMDALADNFAMLYISAGGTNWLYVNDGLGDRWFRRNTDGVFMLDEAQSNITLPDRARASFNTNWSEVPIPDECRRG